MVEVVQAAQSQLALAAAQQVGPPQLVVRVVPLRPAEQPRLAAAAAAVVVRETSQGVEQVERLRLVSVVEGEEEEAEVEEYTAG